MGSFRNYIIVGLVVATFGSLLLVGGMDPLQPNYGMVVFGMLLLGVGGTVAGVGVAAWGVHLGTRDLRQLLAESLGADRPPIQQTPKGNQVADRAAAATPDRTPRGVDPPRDESGVRRSGGVVKMGAARLALLAPPPDASPGWRDDPATGGDQLRWWDGVAWRREVRDHDTEDGN